MAVDYQRNELTVTLPADVMRELNMAYEASCIALAAVLAAHDGDETVLAQARGGLAVAERELATAYDRAAGELWPLGRAVLRAVLLAAEHFAEQATKHQHLSGEAGMQS